MLQTHTLLILLFLGGIDGIYQKNKLLEQAQRALEQAQTASIQAQTILQQDEKAAQNADYQDAKRRAEDFYQKAKEYYFQLITDFEVQDEQVKLNLAHIYFYLEKEKMAKNPQSMTLEEQPKSPFEISKKYYAELSLSLDKTISSTALNQLGIVESTNAIDPKSSDLAIEHFKEALKQNPANHLARYNYEVMIRQKAQQNQNEQDKQDNSEHKQTEENKDNQNQASNADQQEQKKEQQEEESDKKDDSKRSRDAMLRAIDLKPLEYPNLQRFKPKKKHKKTKNW